MQNREGTVVLVERKVSIQGLVEASSLDELLTTVRYQAKTTETEIDRLPIQTFLERLLLYLESGNKIQAIKFLREWSWISLIDAKIICDRIVNVSRA